MRRLGAGLAACLLLCAAAPAVRAQTGFVLDLGRGAEVRLEARSDPGNRLVGKVFRSTPDTLAVVPRGSTLPVGYEVGDLVSLELRGGEDRRRGVLRGAAIGAGLTVIFGGIDLARGKAEAGEVAGITVGNALIGGLIGYAFSPRGWQRLPLPTGATWTARPAEPGTDRR